MNAGDIMDEKKYVDMEAGLARVRGNMVIFKKMLGMFLQSKEFAAFEESLEKKDYPKAAEVAHAIKGLTGNLALTSLFEESTKLMNQLREGTYDEETIRSYRSALTETRTHVEGILASS
jgi:HPt (histidine-containing phosphotransfer) domain-containing protein